MNATAIEPGFRDITRAGGENLFLHLESATCRFPPYVGPVRVLPWIVWKAYFPGNPIPFARGVAITEEGAERKAWRAFDTLFPFAAGKWSGGAIPWEPNDLRQDFNGGRM